MEDSLVRVIPDKSHFKSHLLFFNSLSVIGAGQKMLEEIAKNLVSNPSYANEANEYEVSYIIKV